jgi:hypothetical protein
MANRINNHPNHQLNSHNPTINYILDAGSSSKRQNKFSNVDDVIVSLADAYENRRARQATEWERMGRQSLQMLL